MLGRPWLGGGAGSGVGQGGQDGAGGPERCGADGGDEGEGEAAAGSGGGAMSSVIERAAGSRALHSLGRAFAARFPEVELLTEEMWNGVMPASLRSGAIDLAVALCP